MACALHKQTQIDILQNVNELNQLPGGKSRSDRRAQAVFTSPAQTDLQINIFKSGQMTHLTNMSSFA